MAHVAATFNNTVVTITDAQGNASANGLVDATHPYGPYFSEIQANAMNNSKTVVEGTGAAVVGAFGRGANGAAGPFGSIEQAWLSQGLGPRSRSQVLSLNATLGFVGMAVGAACAILPGLVPSAIPVADAYRPIFGIALACSTGILNRTPYAYAAAWGRAVFFADNLLVNAGQAIEGEGRVSVRTRLEGTCVHISVTDSGKGIPAADRASIFSTSLLTTPVSVTCPFCTTMWMGGFAIDAYGQNAELS